MNTAPSGASQRRATSAAKVVLPLPVGPTIASVEPAGILKLMSRRTPSVGGAVPISAGVCAATGHSRRIGKCEIAEFDVAFDLLFRGNFCGAVVNLRLRCENVIEPAHGCGSALENIGDPSERDHRPHEDAEKTVEGNQARRMKSRPRRTRWPPCHKTIRKVMPISAWSEGMNMLQVRINLTLRETYSRFGSSKPRISASSCA